MKIRNVRGIIPLFLIFIQILIVIIPLNNFDTSKDIDGENIIHDTNSVSKKPKVNTITPYNILPSGNFSMTEIKDGYACEFFYRAYGGSSSYGPVGGHPDDIITMVSINPNPPYNVIGQFEANYPHLQYYKSSVNKSHPSLNTGTHDFIRVDARSLPSYMGGGYDYEYWLTRYYHKEVRFIKDFSISQDDIDIGDIRLYGLHTINKTTLGYGEIKIYLFSGSTLLKTIWSSSQVGNYSVDESILDPIKNNGPGTYRLRIDITSRSGDFDIAHYESKSGSSNEITNHTIEFMSQVKISNLNITCYESPRFRDCFIDNINIPKLSGENVSVSGSLKNLTDHGISDAIIYPYWFNTSQTWASRTMVTDFQGRFSNQITIPETISSLLNLKLNYTKPTFSNSSEYLFENIRVFSNITTTWEINGKLEENEIIKLEGQITSLTNQSLKINNRTFSLYYDGQIYSNFSTDETGNFSV